MAAVPVSVWQVEQSELLNWVLPAATLPLLELPELLDVEELLELDELLDELLELEELLEELLELGSPELELEPPPPHAIKVADNSRSKPQRPKLVGCLWMRMCVTKCCCNRCFFMRSNSQWFIWISPLPYPNLILMLPSQSTSHFHRQLIA